MTSTPESEFDSWYEITHPKGTATWEDDEELPDREIMDDIEE